MGLRKFTYIMKEVNMLIYLLLTAAVILLSLILGRVSSRLGLPTLLVLFFSV